jgi:hypothetical protein
MMKYLGIDPGKKGGWALLDKGGTIIDAASLNLADLRDFAKAVDEADEIGLERAQAAPEQGHQFEYGRGFGRLEGVIMAVRSLDDVLYLAPAFWKSRMGVTADKARTVQSAIRLMPELRLYENRLGNVPDGIAEAALMARCVMSEATREQVRTNKAARVRQKARKRVVYRD